MKMVLASRNAHKIAELEALLAQYVNGVEILSLNDVGMMGEIEENGTTFEENALIKARAAAASGYIGLGDDSGLSVRALGGAPGIYSARYAGEHGNTAENNTLLLKNMEGITDRYAEFVCAIACVLPSGEEFCVRGISAGEILSDYHGEGGFGYDPLFLDPKQGKTFAEMSAAEKNAVSHRGRAVRKFADFLCNHK
jgi:XTP/dITP diphosphohydrolase